MSIIAEIRQIASRAKEAAATLGHASPQNKNLFLQRLSELITVHEPEIMQANRLDIQAAMAAGMDAPALDRLTLNSGIIAEMRAACGHVADLPDPVGATETQWQRPNGLLVGKMRIPIGVIAMIYESRPNVTIDAAMLCIKAGNAIILRGGSEAINSNIALMKLLRLALEHAGLPADCAQLVENRSHEAVMALCGMDEYIDVIIPRGGEGLIRAVCEAARMPVLRHFKGVCHAYIDASADLHKALAIIENSKCQRPGVCNALECLLVHRDVAPRFLPLLAQKLDPHNVEFRACPGSFPMLGPHAVQMRPEDCGCEFHAKILAVLLVRDMDEAMAHIRRYGSNHTEIICTENYAQAMRFLREVDASMVAVNASSRFNDGGQLGLGAEIGISTSKLHSYGPMGVNELTTTKFVVLGNGQVRD